MGTITDHAIALRRLDYSETSQIISFFTRDHGQVRVLGKGIKKGTKARFAVGVDLLDVGQLTIGVRGERPTGLANMIEWKQTTCLSGLREKLDRLLAAQYAAEITSQLTQEWDPHSDLFDALLSLLEKLSLGEPAIMNSVQFQTHLLSGIGSSPRFESCVQCGKTESLAYFSSHSGGVVCNQCAQTTREKKPVTAKTLATLQGSPAESFDGPFLLLNYHISHLMGRPSVLAPKLVPPRKR